MPTKNASAISTHAAIQNVIFDPMDNSRSRGFPAADGR
jgi:hypothetical protein